MVVRSNDFFAELLPLRCRLKKSPEKQDIRRLPATDDTKI